MDDSLNPLLPVGPDIAWTAVSALMIVLFIVALVSIARTAKRLSANQALIWTLGAIFLPIIGPIAWLSIGRRSAPAQAQVTKDR